MRGSLVLLTLFAATGSARAEPPAPLMMPELAPRHRLVVSPLVSSGLFINLAQLAVAGTYAIDCVELFGDVRARVSAVVNIGGGSNEDSGTGLGNIRLGARYHVRRGTLRVSPAAWAWLPTSNASRNDHFVYAQMGGTDNSRGFGPAGTALGVGLDVGWHRGTTFAQLQVGSAIVADEGPQIDNVFGAVGAGWQASKRTSFLLEYRVDAFSQGGVLHGPAIGFGRHDGTAASWRMRFHPVVFPGREWFALSIGFDISRRF